MGKTSEWTLLYPGKYMRDKHMEMQIKTAVRYHYITIRISKLIRLPTSSVSEDAERLDLIHCWWEGSTHMRTVYRLSLPCQSTTDWELDSRS